MSIKPTETTLPMNGIRVLDFTHALAGPYCTLVLADYGAEVIKLESPGQGDMGRGWGPPFIHGESAFFLGLNRGKRGISIDLKKPEGIALCLQLIDRMDVVLENFRPGTMDKLGLGHEPLRKRNPRLVYCSISGYGQDGPSRDEAAMDLIVQSSSGLLGITGTEAGELVRSGYSVTDVTAGMFAVIGILMALRQRERTGVGQYVDVSMFDTMISTMSSNYMNYLGSGVQPPPLGTGFPTIVPYRVYNAKDRGFAIAIGSEKLWEMFCAAIDRSDLASDPAYATNALRTAHRKALDKILEDLFLRTSAEEWLLRLRRAGIPCSLVNSMEDVVNHPQSVYREMFPAIHHPVSGQHRVTGAPLKFSESPVVPDAPAPLLGEHTASVLAEMLQLDARTIDSLLQAGIVCETRPQAATGAQTIPDHK